MSVSAIDVRGCDRSEVRDEGKRTYLKVLMVKRGASLVCAKESLDEKTKGRRTTEKKDKSWPVLTENSKGCSSPLLQAVAFHCYHAQKERVCRRKTVIAGVTASVKQRQGARVQLDYPCMTDSARKFGSSVLKSSWQVR